jgi:hypothetical protein
MEGTATANGKVWEIVPSNALVTFVFIVLFAYLFFRHFLFVLMLSDVVLGWLRRFNWFPREGKRRKTLIHWVVAATMLGGFLLIGSLAGWVRFVPR